MRQRMFRWLLLVAMLGMAWPASAFADLTQEDPGEQYQDPEGRYSVPVPAGWTAEDHDDYGLLTSPDGSITVAILVVEADDPTEGITRAWKIVEPGFALEPLQERDIPPSEGADAAGVITYDNGQESGEIVQGLAQMVDSAAYVMLVRADVKAAQERQSQINIIVTGFDITALEKVSLEGVEPLAFDGDLVTKFERYVGGTMKLLHVPGATIAIVQDGEVVYRQGFGVTELGGGEPVVPETQMMIGSTTKPVTTMMLATLVDDGIIAWDTPVVDILPEFAVADPELTPKITVKDLVCACTGVPRQDLELLFNASTLTARDIVHSIAGFEFYTPIGEVFQYSNQMVAAAGYAGAAAVHGDDANLHDAYVEEVTHRILDPIGMEHTTFSFNEVVAGGNAATPHGLNLDGDYVAMPIDQERFVVPIAPSGGLWSNVDDMARFIMTQLAHGKAPDGTTVVSAENLKRTWEPQVPVTAETSYGLGWFVDAYKGQPLMHHGGNTYGFTSDLAFLPDADLGIVVLTNGQGANLFTEAVRYRLLELVFGQEPEFQAQVEAVLEGEAETDAADTGAPGSAATPVGAVRAVDPDEVAPFIGEFENEDLGRITTSLKNGDFVLDAGEFQTGLLRATDAPEGTAGYLMADPPVAGLPVELRSGDDGQATIIVGAGLTSYTFTPVAAAGATPVATPVATPAS